MTSTDVNAFTETQQSSVAESFCATLDYIPLVSTVSGIARIIFGTIEAGIGVLALPVQIAERMHNPKQTFIFNHGIANIVRGMIAAKPIIGNIVVYIYDHSLNTKLDIQKAAGLIL